MRNWKKRALAGCMAAMLAAVSLGATAFAEEAASGAQPELTAENADGTQETGRQGWIDSLHAQIDGMIRQDLDSDLLRAYLTEGGELQSAVEELRRCEQETQAAIEEAGTDEEAGAAYEEGIAQARAVVLQVYQIAAVSQVVGELELAMGKLEENRTEYVSDAALEELISGLQETAYSLMQEMSQADSVGTVLELADQFQAAMEEANLEEYRWDVLGRLQTQWGKTADEIQALPNLSDGEKAEYLAELEGIMKEAPSAVDRTDAGGMEAVAEEYAGYISAVLDRAKAADQRKADGGKEPDKKPAQTEQETGKTGQSSAKPAQTTDDVPRTGDVSHASVYILLAAGSLAVLLVLCGKRALRRR